MKELHTDLYADNVSSSMNFVLMNAAYKNFSDMDSKPKDNIDPCPETNHIYCVT